MQESQKIIEFQIEMQEQYYAKKRERKAAIRKYLEMVRSICLIGDSRNELKELVWNIRAQKVSVQLQLHFDDLLKIGGITYSSEMPMTERPDLISKLNNNLDEQDARIEIIKSAISLILEMSKCEVGYRQKQTRFIDYAEFLIDEYIFCLSREELMDKHYKGNDYIRNYRSDAIAALTDYYYKKLFATSNIDALKDINI